MCRVVVADGDTTTTGTPLVTYAIHLARIQAPREHDAPAFSWSVRLFLRSRFQRDASATLDIQVGFTCACFAARDGTGEFTPQTSSAGPLQQHDGRIVVASCAPGMGIRGLKKVFQGVIHPLVLSRLQAGGNARNPKLLSLALLVRHRFG